MGHAQCIDIDGIDTIRTELVLIDNKHALNTLWNLCDGWDSRDEIAVRTPSLANVLWSDFVSKQTLLVEGYSGRSQPSGVDGYVFCSPRVLFSCIIPVECISVGKEVFVEVLLIASIDAIKVLQRLLVSFMCSLTALGIGGLFQCFNLSVSFFETKLRWNLDTLQSDSQKTSCKNLERSFLHCVYRILFNKFNLVELK